MPAKRDKQGRFVKGQSGNPKGRPGIPEELRKMANESPERIKEMIDDPLTPVKVRADLLKWTFEMVYGRPKQGVDLEGKLDTPPATVKFEGILDEWSK